MPATKMSCMPELIPDYFKQGYNNQEFLEFLKLHDIEISLSTLKRRLQTLGLFRNRKQGSLLVVSENELRSTVQNQKQNGYSRACDDTNQQQKSN